MHKQCTWSHGSIHYQILGKGTAVVLLHGFGEDSSIWKEQVNYLQENYMVIIPDLPGTGASEWNVVNSEWSMVNDVNDSLITIDKLAESIYAILVTEKIDQCCMLGHSMGGYITLAFAEKYPDRLKKFGLIHSTAFADSEEKKNNRWRGIELMQEYGGHAFLKTTIPNLFGEKYKHEHLETIDQLIKKASLFSTPILQAYYYAMMHRPDRTSVLQGNPLPVLFVLGTEDVAAPLNDVLQQTHLPLNSYIHILDGVGHMGMLESTERMNHYIDAFIHQS